MRCAMPSEKRRNVLVGGGGGCAHRQDHPRQCAARGGRQDHRPRHHHPRHARAPVHVIQLGGVVQPGMGVASTGRSRALLAVHRGPIAFRSARSVRAETLTTPSLKAWGTGHPAASAPFMPVRQSAHCVAWSNSSRKKSTTAPRALIVETIDLIAVLAGRGPERRLVELERSKNLAELRLPACIHNNPISSPTEKRHDHIDRSHMSVHRVPTMVAVPHCLDVRDSTSAYAAGSTTCPGSNRCNRSWSLSRAQWPRSWR